MKSLLVLMLCEDPKLILMLYLLALPVAEDLLLQEDLIHMLPMVNEANAMSEELDKKVKFEVALIAPQARGLKEGRTEVKTICESINLLANDVCVFMILLHMTFLSACFVSNSKTLQLSGDFKGCC